MLFVSLSEVYELYPAVAEALSEKLVQVDFVPFVLNLKLYDEYVFTLLTTL